MGGAVLRVKEERQVGELDESVEVEGAQGVTALTVFVGIEVGAIDGTADG